MPARVDLVALHAEEYAAGRAPRLVPVTPARFVSLDGEGPLPGPAFDVAALALAGLVRGLRARARRDGGVDFRLPPLETLLADRPRVGVAAAPNAAAAWRLLMRVPAFVRPADVAALAAWEGGPAAAARIEELREGRCLQALHVGPLSGLGEAAERLRGAAADLGLAPRGRIHCAWLSAPGRTSPERQRLLVRLPVKPR